MLSSVCSAAWDRAMSIHADRPELASPTPASGRSPLRPPLGMSTGRSPDENRVGQESTLDLHCKTSRSYWPGKSVPFTGCPIKLPYINSLIVYISFFLLSLLTGGGRGEMRKVGQKFFEDIQKKDEISDNSQNAPAAAETRVSARVDLQRVGFCQLSGQRCCHGRISPRIVSLGNR